MLEQPYYIHYSEPRMMVHNMVTSKYFDLAISAVIGLNVITMAMEFYMMPKVKMKLLKCIIFGESLILDRNNFFRLSKILTLNQYIFISLDFSLCSESFQLFLYCCFHPWSWNENWGPWLWTLFEWQVFWCKFMMRVFTPWESICLTVPLSFLSHPL